MNPLQKCNAHSSLQFYRRRSNRFGENRLTDACRAVFQKQAAPKSHAFLFCHEPLPPSTRCGELRGGLSSRPPGAESSNHRSKPRRVGLLRKKSARSTEFPLRRLAVRGCERTMSGQYRAVRWFLLPEAELRPRRQSADCKNSVTQSIADCKPAKTEAGAADYKSAETNRIC